MTEKVDKLQNSFLEFKKITYDGAKLTDNRKDLPFMAANTEFIAMVPDTDGASFCVWALDNTQSKVTTFLKHKTCSACLVLEFDRFFVNRIIAGCESGKFYQYHIDMALSTEQALPQYIHDYCSSVPVAALFHPSASNVAFLVNAKMITCVNLTDWSIIRQTEVEEEILSASLNHDGTKMVCSYGDGKARILCTTSFSVLYVANLDNKRTSVQYLTGLPGDFFAVSLKVSNCRAVKTYKATFDGSFTEGKPDTKVVSTVSSGTSTSTKKWQLIYDPDINILILPTGGESSVYFAHYNDSGDIFESSVIRCDSSPNVPIKSMVAGPKLSVNPAEKELLRLYKATTTCIEVYAFKHPRRANSFEKTLYPPTLSTQPAMTVEEFIAGQVKPPSTFDMESLFNDCKKCSINRSQSVLGSSGGERLATSPLSFSSPYSGVSSSEVDDLKKKIDILSHKMEDVLKRLEQLEGSQ